MLKPIKTNQECEQALERVYNLMQKISNLILRNRMSWKFYLFLLKNTNQLFINYQRRILLLQLSLDLNKKICLRKI